MQVIKKDKSREPFSREKIERGVQRACWKRPVSSDSIRELASAVEADIVADYADHEIDSSIIGRMVMERLMELDEVAYIRFASVYREFKSVQDFVAEVVPRRAVMDGEGVDGGEH